MGSLTREPESGRTRPLRSARRPRSGPAFWGEDHFASDA